MANIIYKKVTTYQPEIKQTKEVSKKETKKEINHSRSYYKANKLVLGNGEKHGIIFRIFLYVFLIVLSYVFLEPLISMIFTSFMSNKDIVDPEVIYIPKNFAFSNYKVAFQVMKYWSSLFNSIWFSAVLAILQTTVSALAGYAFARYDFKGKKFWYAILIVTFLIPVQVLIIPRRMLISIFQKLTGMTIMSSVIPQIVLSILGQGINSTVLVLIFINFFKQIPIALDEAAVMDGATTWQSFYHIILKLSAPIIFTVFLFSFVWNWNDTISMSFYLGGRLNLLPTQLGAFDNLFGSANVGSKQTESYKMAGSLLSILPLIILYVIVQKRFVEGIEQTGMTGQ